MAEQRQRTRGCHFSVTLPLKITQRLQALADQRGSSRAAIVTEAVLLLFRQIDSQQAPS